MLRISRRLGCVMSRSLGAIADCPCSYDWLALRNSMFVLIGLILPGAPSIPTYLYPQVTTLLPGHCACRQAFRTIKWKLVYR